MKTIIFDIDGTITDMRPIENAVLLSMLGRKFETRIEKLYQSGLKDTYVIFCSVSQAKFGKIKYRKMYNQTFSSLEHNGLLPQPPKYPVVDWIKKNKARYRFVYATGGQKRETEYALRCLGLGAIFENKHSLSKSDYRFSKLTGLPFKKIKLKFSNCLVITDSRNDFKGAALADMPCVMIKPGQKFSDSLVGDVAGSAFFP